MAVFKPVRVVRTKYGTYSLHYTSPDGRRRRLSVGSDEKHAQRLSVKVTDWLLEGKDPEREMERSKQEEQARALSLKDFFPVYMRRHGQNQSGNTQRLYKTCMDNITRCPELSEAPLGNIRKKLVIDYMQARMKNDGVVAATVNREATLVKGMLSRAVEWDILEGNPLQGLKLLKESEKREVNITPEQMTLLLGLLPESIADIVEFALYTGFRKENILSLKIEQVIFHDLKPTGEVRHTTKGGKKETSPLGVLAVDTIRRVIGDRKSGYVFLNPRTSDRYYSIHKSFNKAIRQLGLTAEDVSKLRFHDLRHIVASWLNQNNVPLDVIRKIFGHRDRKTTDRYTTLKVAGDVLDVLPRLRAQ